MSLKQELVQWDQAVKAFDQGDYEYSIELFEPIADSSKIHFNIGMILQTLGEHEQALQAFEDSIVRDGYLAVAYFQKGVSHYMLQDFEGALQCFQDATEFMRGNKHIDYSQLGLDYKLYTCECLYNAGLCLFMLGDDNAALTELQEASKAKQLPEHDQIDLAIRGMGENFQVFQVPSILLYKPPTVKIQNVNKVNYLGTSKVVAAVDAADNFTEFSGARGMKKEPEPEFQPFPSRPRQTLEASILPTRSNSRPRNGSNPTLRIDSVRRGQPNAPSGPTSPNSRNPSTLGRPRGGGDNFDTLGSSSVASTTMGRSRSLRGLPSFNMRDDYSTTSSTSRASPNLTASRPVKSTKYKVKVNLEGTRPTMFMMPEESTLDQLVTKIQDKLNISDFQLMFRDEEGEFVSMNDDDDLLLARELADSDKIEIFCDL